MHDVLVVGAGPAGRAVAAACAERGLCTAVLDPAPSRPWRATYGTWSDELPADLPAEVVAVRARGTAVAITHHQLGREYSVLDVPALRAYLDRRLAAAGVDVEQGRARSGAAPPAHLVIDAGGPEQPMSHGRARRSPAEQTAYGVVLPAELAGPVLSRGEALFMDWRPIRGDRAADFPTPVWPTFLYAVPVGGRRVLLEETSLARRPGLAPEALAGRLRRRLAGHGIAVPPDADREVVRFRLDAARHRAPGVLGFGAAAPLTHPCTGYQLATALRAAPLVARALADRWTDGPAAALAAARAVLWPAAARATHLLRRRGLESLLRMPPELVPEFFEGFFRLPPCARDAYLDGRTRPWATAAAMAGLFRTTRWPVRLRLIGSSLLVSAPPEHPNGPA